MVGNSSLGPFRQPVLQILLAQDPAAHDLVAVNERSRRPQDATRHDGIQLGDLHHLGVKAVLFHEGPGGIGGLIALGATGSVNFNSHGVLPINIEISRYLISKQKLEQEAVHDPGAFAQILEVRVVPLALNQSSDHRRRKGGSRRPAQAIVHELTVADILHQPGLAEDPEVPRNGGLTEVHQIDQLTHAETTNGKGGEDPHSRGIRHRLAHDDVIV